MAKIGYYYIGNVPLLVGIGQNWIGVGVRIKIYLKNGQHFSKLIIQQIVTTRIESKESLIWVVNVLFLILGSMQEWLFNENINSFDCH